MRPIGAEGGYEHWATQLCQGKDFLTRCIAQRGARGALSTAELPKRPNLTASTSFFPGCEFGGVYMFRRENAPLAVMTLVSLAILAVFIASS